MAACPTLFIRFLILFAGYQGIQNFGGALLAGAAAFVVPSSPPRGPSSTSTDTCLPRPAVAYAAHQQTRGSRRYRRRLPFFAVNVDSVATDKPGIDKTDKRLAAAETKILEYLDSADRGVAAGSDDFQIQGWRWHTMALIREASQLQKLAAKTSERFARSTTTGTVPRVQMLRHLKAASEYVVDFNMRGLHKIERDIFFPWARQKVRSTSNSKVPVAEFMTLMDRLDKDRSHIERLGKKLNEAADAATDPLADDGTVRDALREIASRSQEIATSARSMLQLEDAYLVPVIGNVVPVPEQKNFNDRVIRNLGILDSRLHLVGMYEAVWALPAANNGSKERQLFQQTIPKLPQMMIPRWKRKLYEPRIGTLLNEV